MGEFKGMLYDVSVSIIGSFFIGIIFYFMGATFFMGLACGIAISLLSVLLRRGESIIYYIIYLAINSPLFVFAAYMWASKGCVLGVC